MIKTIATTKEITICPECEQEIYKCLICDDYIFIDHDIFCRKDEELDHIHCDCLKLKKGK